MKVKVIGRVFGQGGLVPLGKILERDSADGVIYEEVKAEPEKTLEVATPKRGRKPKDSE